MGFGAAVFVALIFFADLSNLSVQAVPQVTPVAQPPPQLVAPSMPPGLSGLTAFEERSLQAARTWETGDPASVVAAYESLSFTPPESGAWSEEQRRFYSDWIDALIYVDAVSAQQKLTEWQSLDMPDAFSRWPARRLVLQTKILVQQGQTEQALKGVKAAVAQRLAAYKALQAEERALKKAGRRGPESRLFQALAADDFLHRRALFHIAAATGADTVFDAFATPASNPFHAGQGSLFVRPVDPVSCAATGLLQSDWVLLDVAFPEDVDDPVIRPIAQSRPDVLTPFMQAAYKWNFGFRAARRDEIRMPLLLRCGVSLKRLRLDTPHMKYLLDHAKSLSKTPGTRVDDSRGRPGFVDRMRTLERWDVLANIAVFGDSYNTSLPRLASDALLAKLQSGTMPDALAITLLNFRRLPYSGLGDMRRAKLVLPEYEAFNRSLKTANVLPATTRAWMETTLANLYEITGNTIAARRIYEEIVTLAPGMMPENAPEVIHSHLRLAAIAESQADSLKADMILKTLGLDPEQCSIYQSKPTLTRFREPEFPQEALRNALEGSVYFEFDLDKTGQGTNFRVLVSAPPLVFDAQTLMSFQKANFLPVTRGRDAVPCNAAQQGFVWRMP